MHQSLLSYSLEVSVVFGKKTKQRMASDRQGESLSCEDDRCGDMGPAEERTVWQVSEQ